MASLNRIVLVGRLVEDPEIRSTVEGLQIAKFQLAVDKYTQEGAPKQFDIIDIVAWEKLAEVVGKFVKKGKIVLIEGRIQVRTFETENGQKKWATEVVARSMKMLGNASKEESVPAAVFAESDQVPGASELPEEESDLPF